MSGLDFAFRHVTTKKLRYANGVKDLTEARARGISVAEWKPVACWNAGGEYVWHIDREGLVRNGEPELR